MQTPGYLMYINKGQDDEMEICCFRTSRLKIVFTYLVTVLTGGALRLIFHWIPHWYVFATCNACGVGDAEKVLVKEIFGGKHTIYHVKDLKVLTPESVQKLKDDDGSFGGGGGGESEVAALSVHFENGEWRELDKLFMFNCKKVTYIWDCRKHEFVKLHGLDQSVSSDTLHKNQGLTASEQFTRRLVYGPNKIIVKELSILTLLFLEVLNPFYIFQIGSFILWFLDDYYYYAAAIITMSVFGISMTVRQTRKNQRKLKSTVHSSDICTVLRRTSKSDGSGDVKYTTEPMSTELLVPGDVLVIPSHGCVMHCDAILLTGNCILNESMLTGESVPVTKTALPNLAEIVYDAKEHARHTLFCGTQVIQTRYFGNEKVLAVVVRTGFSTAKGSLVRSILYPPPVDFRFEKDSYRFVMLLAAVALVGFIYTVITKVMRGVSSRDLVIEAFDLITIVVPPALPAAMTVGRFYAQIRLKKNKIFCISPRSINVSGSIDCVCFDKTGTLTEDGLDLLCVVPIKEKNFHMPVKKVSALPSDVFFCGLVSCHSLTIIDKQIVGDPLDLKMFESTKWVMEEHDVADNSKFNMIFPTVLKPPRNDDDLQIGIIREFPFSSSSQRMGVIVRKLTAQHFEYYAKGSPEMILNFVRDESVPSDFHDVLESYTQEGYRVIALAHKELKLSYAKVNKVQRDAIEKDMTLLGLIVLENRLKPETTPCIQALNDASIRVVMVTGDNILTALSVAKDCDIVTPRQSVITVNIDNSTPPKLYYTLTNTKNKNSNEYSVMTDSASIVSLDTIESQIQSITTNSTVKVETKKPQSLYNNYRFAMTGKVWGVVKEHYPDLLPKLVTRGTVFARMSPEQKQQLVQELQTLGYCVAMCGDGANDCGALKAAHTGISLSEAESSVASPFTSRNANISCVLNVIKEGRAALVTSFGIFKYMAAYSLCQFVSVLILYSIDSNLTDLEFLYIDLCIISIFAFFFGKTEAYSGKLVKETPLSSLISVSPILSLLLQMLLVIAIQVGAFEHLKMQTWYTQFDASQVSDKDEVACVENFVIFTVSSFQYIILAVVFSKGKPYRRSIFSNYGFVLSAILMVGFSVYLALWPAAFFVEQFELVQPPSFDFCLYLLVYAVVNFVLSIFIEQAVIDYLVFKKLRFKFHNVDKSKRRYLAIERDIDLDTKWPVLTSDFKSAASPLNPLPTCTAEIVVEKEKFDKNHVLNKLYEGEVRRFIPNGQLLQDDLPFSSLPSESSPSLSETYKSFPSNTSYDLANSQTNIAELPFDSVAVSVPERDNLASFNSLGRSPKNVAPTKELEMSYLENR
ncbi:polyamine-transporting ATPase 13A3-like isoform X2 [Zophobas morio]